MNRVASEATEGAIAGGIGATTATAMGATVDNARSCEYTIGFG